MVVTAGEAAGPVPDRREWAWLAVILGVALLIRLVVLVRLPNIYFPDEIMQYLEQAHRIVFGYGMVPGDVTLGIRTMTVAGVLAVPMALASLISDEPEVLTGAVGVTITLFSLLAIVGAWIGARRISLLHAIVAASVVAIWYEAIHHAARPLTETMATAPLVLALGLSGATRLQRRDLVLIGVLLGVCVALRMHLAPAAAVVGVWLIWRHGWRAALPLVVGGLIPILIVGGVDSWVQGLPFGSFINNVRYNILEGMAASFGESPAWQYVAMIQDQWLAVTPTIVVLVLLGARRLPLWLLTAAAIIVTHSLIGHKELRFILPASGVLVVLAAVGSAEVVAWIGRELQGSRWRRLALPALLVTWAATSFLLANGPSQQYRWSDRRAILAAEHYLHDQPEVCGIALRGLEWWETGGYAHLHLRVPIYRVEAGQPDDHPEAYDVQLFRTSRQAEPPAGYEEQACFTDRGDEVCVLRRQGGCRHVDGFEPTVQTDGVAF